MGLKPCNLNLNPEKKQLSPQGTAGFPCAAYERLYTDKPEHMIPWHWHEELEIAHVKKGSLQFQIPGKSFLLTKGDCIVINSNMLHGGGTPQECELQSLVFHPRLITGSSDSAIAAKYVSPLLKHSLFDGFVLKAQKRPLEISSFCHAFDALVLDSPGFEFTVRANLSQICFFLYRHFKPNASQKAAGQSPDQLRSRKMLKYIHTHFQDFIALSDIARAADIGERECLRCFQRNIQLPPMQYLLKYRVMQGADFLLQEPGASISQIALSCGFDSPSHFSKMFRRFYDCSPREYRKSREDVETLLNQFF